MTDRLREYARTLPILVPVAAIFVASFGGIEWLRLAGMWSLSAAVFLLVLRGRFLAGPPVVSGKQVALGAGIAVGVFFAAFLPHSSLGFLALPLLVGLLLALLYLIGWIVFRLLQLSRDVS